MCKISTLRTAERPRILLQLPTEIVFSTSVQGEPLERSAIISSEDMQPVGAALEEYCCYYYYYYYLV